MTSERRRFFRIDSEIAVNVEPLTSDESPTLESLEKQRPRAFGLLADIHDIAREAEVALRQIQARDSAVADFCRSIDKRLELLTRFVAVNALSDPVPQRVVSLSGNGMRFFSEQSLQPGQAVRIEMLLPDLGAAILCYGEVVDCKTVDGGFQIALTFTVIREADRDAIVRHVLAKESERLRLLRHQNKQGESV